MGLDTFIWGLTLTVLLQVVNSTTSPQPPLTFITPSTLPPSVHSAFEVTPGQLSSTLDTLTPDYSSAWVIWTPSSVVQNVAVSHNVTVVV